MLAPTEHTLRRKIRFAQLVAWLALFFTTVGIASGYVNWLRINSKASQALADTQALKLQLNQPGQSTAAVKINNVGINNISNAAANSNADMLRQLQSLNLANASYLYQDNGFSALQHIALLQQAQTDDSEQNLKNALNALHTALTDASFFNQVNVLNQRTEQALRDLLFRQTGDTNPRADATTDSQSANSSWLNQHLKIQRFKHLDQQQHALKPAIEKLSAELHIQHSTGQRYQPQALSQGLHHISQAMLQLIGLSEGAQKQQWQTLRQGYLSLQKQLINTEQQFKLTQQALMQNYQNRMQAQQ